MTDAGLDAALSREEILTTLVRRLGEMAEDWDREDLSAPIAAGTALRAQLGFSSMDLVMLVVDIQGLYGRNDFPWEDLFAPQGTYVDDVKVGEIVDFLCRYLIPTNPS